MYAASGLAGGRGLGGGGTEGSQAKSVGSERSPPHSTHRVACQTVPLLSCLLLPGQVRRPLTGEHSVIVCT